MAQKIICEDIKDRIRKEGLSIAIDEHRPTRMDGAKEERIAAVLEPRYENMSIFHFRGGYTPALEEELILARPQHDDIKDAFAAAVEIMVAPRKIREKQKQNKTQIYSSKFGGVRFGGN